MPAGFTPPPGPARPGAETERSEGSRAGAFGRAVIVPALVATVVGMAFVVVFLDAFHHPVPHHLPVAVVGDAQQTGQVRSALERATPGQFQVERIADQAGARSALLHEDVYAAFVPGRQPSLLTAGANGQGVTQTVTQAFTPIAAQSGGQLQVQDVRPLVPGDQRGLGIFYGAFGVVLGGFIFGLLSYQAAPQLALRWRVLSIVLFAAASGMLAGLASDVMYSAIPAGWWKVSAIVALLALSIGATAALALRVIGSAATFVLSVGLITLGNATSTGNLPQQYLPPWMQPLSGILPPGVTVRALRGVTYFADDGVSRAVWVLALWSVVPLLLIGAVDRLQRRRQPHGRHEPGETDDDRPAPELVGRAGTA